MVQNQHATSKHELLLSNGSDHMKYADEGSQRDSLMNSHIENMGAEDNQNYGTNDSFDMHLMSADNKRRAGLPKEPDTSATFGGKKMISPKAKIMSMTDTLGSSMEFDENDPARSPVYA